MARSRFRAYAVAVALAGAASLAGCATAAPRAVRPEVEVAAQRVLEGVGPLFGSYWRSPIPTSPRLDPGSSEMVRYLAGKRGRVIANLYDYGIPIFRATPTTPGVPVRCTKPWGPCDLERRPIPVPAHARPNVGYDGVLVVVDQARDRSYEFWQARKTADGWDTSWGETVDLSGPGTGGATGSGVSRLAGVVRAQEIADRSIQHPLVFSTSNACRRGYRTPATKTDGGSTRTDCIPEGARIQLSPSINVDAIPGMTAGERVVARALQRYGAYAIDVGAARMAFSFEKPTSGIDPYPAAGFPWDYWDMPHIPWSKLHVLARWDGS